MKIKILTPILFTYFTLFCSEPSNNVSKKRKEHPTEDNTESTAKKKKMDVSPNGKYAINTVCNDDIVNLINTEYSNNYTLLMEAASKNNIKNMEILLSHNININDIDNKGWSALTHAVMNGHKEATQLLLKKGAEKETVINFIAKEKDQYDDTIEYNLLMDAASKNNINAINLLLSLDLVDVNEKDNFGKSALAYAVFKGHKDATRILLDKVGKKDLIDDQDFDGFTYLMEAAQENNTNAINTLLFLGADIHTKEHDGWSALTFAVMNGHEDATTLLLKNGANKDDIIKFKHIDETNLLMLAAQQNKINAINLLLRDFNFDIHAKNKDGWSALTFAVMNRHKDATTFLLKNGANKDDIIKFKYNNGATLLMLAAEGNWVNAINSLLSFGIDINAKCDIGRTAAMWASAKNNQQALELLIKHGVAIEFASADNSTVLSLAQRNKNKDMITLIDYWTPILRTFYENKSAENIAKKAISIILELSLIKNNNIKHKDIIKIIMEYFEYNFENHLAIDSNEKSKDIIIAFNKLGTIDYNSHSYSSSSSSSLTQS